MSSQPFPYAEVFTAVEQQVIALGAKRLPHVQVTAQLDKFKRFATREIDDAEYFWTLVFVAFYSGFKAATVTSKKEVIKRNFPSWQVVAGYGEADIERILNDPDMIAHERKVRACVANARMEGRRFAAATGLPIRYIDIVLVTFGQVASPDLGIARGVCLKTPTCGVCRVRQHCTFPAPARCTPA